MLISLNWINDFVDIRDLSAEEVARRITMASAEVEGIVRHGEELEGIVAGRIVAWQKHPESKKLSLAKVDIGGEIVESVCGAPNCREGLLTAFCKAGGKVAGVGTVEARRVGGQPSNGVCCSPYECGLGDDRGAIVELPETFCPGDDLLVLAGVRDAVIEIDNKSLTHRPDLWGHYGFAREIAAILRRPLKALPAWPVERLRGQHPRRVEVRVEDREGCPRYSCLRFDGLAGGAVSPLWMQTRLLHCGLRAINLAVDLTNYILLELGQPTHAFDADKIETIRVASTTEVIRFVTLDGVERSVPPGVLMIYDRDTPVALAGVMGGGNSEVGPATTSVLLESANFNAYRVRRATVELGHRTDSSARFEKSLDPALTVQAIGRFAHLLSQCCPQAVIGSELADVDHSAKEPPVIRVSGRALRRAIGAEIDAETIESILSALCFDVRRQGDEFSVGVPSFRATRDVSIPADLVEEVARIYGYDNIAPRPPAIQLEPYRFNPHRQLERQAKRLLAQRFSLLELHAYPWHDDHWLAKLGETEVDAVAGVRAVRLVNPPAPEYARLRTSLIPGLLAAAAHNQPWREEIGLFELASVFAATPAGECQERKALAAVLTDRRATQGHDAWYFRLKGMVEWLVWALKQRAPEFVPFEPDAPAAPWSHPRKGCWIELDGARLGHFALLRPDLFRLYPKGARVALMELDFDRLADAAAGRATYAPIPRFPLVELDFSLLLDEKVRYREVIARMETFEDPLLRGVHLIDAYSGERLPAGKKSLTFRMVIGSDEGTLTSKEIAGFSARLIARLEQCGWQVRTA